MVFPQLVGGTRMKVLGHEEAASRLNGLCSERWLFEMCVPGLSQPLFFKFFKTGQVLD